MPGWNLSAGMPHVSVARKRELMGREGKVIDFKKTVPEK